MSTGPVHELEGSSLVIRPNRSLPVAGMAFLFVAFAMWTLAVGIGLALVGVWMVVPFAALEVLAVGLLCRWLYRHRDDCELITVEADRLCVIKRHGNALSRHRFPRYWARVRWDRPVPRGRPGKLRVGSHGRFVTLAEEINDEDRARVAQALQSLLRSNA